MHLTIRCALTSAYMKEALYDISLYREFAGHGGMSRLPERVSILRFRHLLEQHKLAEQFLQTVNTQLGAKGYLLKEGTAVDATLIAAPSSTRIGTASATRKCIGRRRATSGILA